jgi:tRNA uridine 5-carboxymethylaminomethyl modification enzyme
MKKSSIIVVGGGHAGIEAALAASRLGIGVILVTMDRAAIAGLQLILPIAALSIVTKITPIPSLEAARAASIPA